MTPKELDNAKEKDAQAWRDLEGGAFPHNPDDKSGEADQLGMTQKELDNAKEKDAQARAQLGLE